jgi:hypothetical protein
VRVGLDSRSDPNEHALDARCCRTLDLVECVENDEAGSGLGGRPKLFVALVVPVHDDSLAGHTGSERVLELAERRDVGAEPFISEQPQQRDVGERLGAIEDQRIGRSLAVGPGEREDRPLAIGDERRPVLVRESRGRNAADRELAPLDRGAVGEEPKQAQSVHQSSIVSASPGPVCGAPIAIISAPSGPASKPRVVSLWTRIAS